MGSFEKVMDNVKKQMTKKSKAQRAYEKMQEDAREETRRIYEEVAKKINILGWYISPEIVKDKRRSDVAIATVLLQPIPYEAFVKISEQEAKANLEKAVAETPSEEGDAPCCGICESEVCKGHPEESKTV